MKAINSYIAEKFQVSKDYKRQYAYTPKDKKELIQCIKEKIEQYGLGTKNKPLDLNDIDTSMITDMSHLFDVDYEEMAKLSLNGYFDISDWNVSNVKTMRSMFYNSKFNGDISDWDVSNVEIMYFMFGKSNFDGDLSYWNVSNVKEMNYMFYYSKFTGKNGDISGWDVSSVTNMKAMFAGSNFDTDLSNWDVSNVEYITGMFTNCPLKNNLPKWYKRK